MHKSLYFLLILILSAVFVSCEKKSDSVIDPSYDSPVIVSVTKSTDTVSTTSSSPAINFVITAVVNDNGGTPVSAVECTLIDPQSASLGTYALDYIQDVTGGKQYSKSVSATGISCLLVGNYTVQLWAKNETGLQSPILNSPLFVKNTANLPPYFGVLSLPDSVVRPVSGSVDLTLYATVNDSNGVCDIKEVYFNAYRPSGFIIPGGSVPMTLVSGNLWTFTNPVLPAAPDSSYGYYKYQFFAKDRSDAVSTGVWDSIKFVRP